MSLQGWSPIKRTMCFIRVYRTKVKPQEYLLGVTSSFSVIGGTRTFLLCSLVKDLDTPDLLYRPGFRTILLHWPRGVRCPSVLPRCPLWWVREGRETGGHPTGNRIGSPFGLSFPPTPTSGISTQSTWVRPTTSSLFLTPWPPYLSSETCHKETMKIRYP